MTKEPNPAAISTVTCISSTPWKPPWLKPETHPRTKSSRRPSGDETSGILDSVLQKPLCSTSLRTTNHTREVKPVQATVPRRWFMTKMAMRHCTLQLQRPLDLLRFPYVEDLITPRDIREALPRSVCTWLRVTNRGIWSPGGPKRVVVIRLNSLRLFLCGLKPWFSRYVPREAVSVDAQYRSCCCQLLRETPSSPTAPLMQGCNHQSTDPKQTPLPQSHLIFFADPARGGHHQSGTMVFTTSAVSPCD